MTDNFQIGIREWYTGSPGGLEQDTEGLMIVVTPLIAVTGYVLSIVNPGYWHKDLSTHHLLFSRLNIPASLSLSLHGLHSNPFINIIVRGIQNQKQYSSTGLISDYTGTIDSFLLCTVLLLMQPQICFFLE